LNKKGAKTHKRNRLPLVDPFRAEPFGGMLKILTTASRHYRNNGKRQLNRVPIKAIRENIGLKMPVNLQNFTF
jgi:hypothetical protein